MNYEIMAQCADLIFADAVQDIAARTGLPTEQVRRKVIESPAYAALYDFETGLWQEGPDYFVGLLALGGKDG
ncbi:hypothetical protein [Arabiibacter massiliensis]|uniref:hypothetical protein n=1 Tax=Arabiibacter massiliensis TaxID=1870985 RepID=UPI0009BB004E|nr:hypothetical protein [Arabiibacter massiliensis]